MKKADSPASTDALGRYSHRGLIVALLLISLLAGCAVLTNLLPGYSNARQLLMLLPLVLVFAIVWVRAALPRAQRRVSAVQIRAIMQDELRQDSQHKAFRLALLSVLICQPLLGVGLTMLPIPGEPLLMAATTVFVGTTAFLATLLFCDRA